MTKNQRPKVVIIGSGFGGLMAAKALRRVPVDITVVSETNHHLFQPLLYQVATGILSEGTIAPSTRDVLEKHRNVTNILGRVYDIDLANNKVHATAYNYTQEYDYDYLLVAAGAGQAYFGNDHFAKHAPGLKTVDDALELRARIFNSFEMAEVAAAHGYDDQVQRLLTFVVVGAGPTGVEMAGQIAELSRQTLPREFRKIDTRKARVILVDAGPAVLATFGEDLSDKAKKRLEAAGVEVRLNTFVTDVQAESVTFKTSDDQVETIPSTTKVWAAGVAASPLAQVLADQSGAEIDRAGRILVEPDLTVPGHRNVFALGDMISGPNNPGVAPHAIQGGEYAARQIRYDIGGHHRDKAFEYRDKGSMATISKLDAVVSVGKIRISGFIAWLMWLVLHLIYIIGFKNQAATVLSWMVTFVTNSRGERTHTEQQALARNVLKTLDGESQRQSFDELTGTTRKRQDSDA